MLYLSPRYYETSFSSMVSRKICGSRVTMPLLSIRINFLLVCFNDWPTSLICTYGAAGHGKGVIAAMSSFGVKNDM